MAASKKKKLTKKEKEKLPNDAPKIDRVNKWKDVSKQATQICSELKKVKPMTNEEMLGFMQSVALGLVEDRFGLEVDMATRVKAMEIAYKMSNEKEDNNNEEEKVVIVDDIDTNSEIK